MATTTLTMTPANLVAAGTSNAAAATTRGVLSMLGAFGGLVTLKITNGGTGPTVQCLGRILIAHTTGSTPSPGSAGADWKTYFEFGGGTGNGTVTEQAFVLPACTHVEAEFTGNTGQAVTVEAIVTVYTDQQTV